MTPAVGVANAYDAHAPGRAGDRSGGLAPTATPIRQGFYKIDKYDGLIKTYVKPFSPGVHDAVQSGDYVWAQFIDNRILPVVPTN